MAKHMHLLVRAEVRRPLIYPEEVCDFLRRAVALAGMNIIGGPWAVMGEIPGNEGPSGAAILAGAAILDFSSTTLHSWIEPPIMEFDIFSCGQTPDPHAFRRLFDETVEPITFDWLLVDRENMGALR